MNLATIAMLAAGIMSLLFAAFGLEMPVLKYGVAPPPRWTTVTEGVGFLLLASASAWQTMRTPAAAGGTVLLFIGAWYNIRYAVLTWRCKRALARGAAIPVR
ncbi:MAG TPA: hypothetical protein VGM77_05930 [Gemmatimonadales bacterium]|jgi:hypothetical protein